MFQRTAKGANEVFLIFFGCFRSDIVRNSAKRGNFPVTYVEGSVLVDKTKLFVDNKLFEIDIVKPKQIYFFKF